MANSSKGDADAEFPVDPLKGEIAALRADLADLARLVGKVSRRRAAGFKSAAETTASESYAKGEAMVDDALAELRSLEDELAEATRRRPFASLGIAALVGFLFGVLFRR